MGGEIDSLEIQISANAQRASQSLMTLITRLDKVNASLNNAGGHGMVSMANGVTQLATAMQGMSNVKTADFTRLTKNIEKLSAVKATQLSGAATAISQLTNSISSLGTVNASAGAKQINDLASGIAKLGYKSSTQAVQNIPKLASAMRQLMSTLSTAPKVSQNLIDMTNALANLAKTGTSSGRAASALSSSLNTYSSATKKARKHTFSLAAAIGKLYAMYWMLIRAMGLIKKAIDISSNLTEVQNVVDTTFKEYRGLVEDMASTSITDFGMSELTTKQIASRYQAMGSAMGIANNAVAKSSEFLAQKGVKAYGDLGDSMANVSVNLTKLAADMASFYNVEQTDVSKDLESIFSGETRPLRTYGLDLTEATLKEWAMKEGLDANISSMSQAEKAMLRYQYVMANTGAAQGDFSKTAGTWANQVRILKQNFEQLGGVLGGTLINALTPLIRAFNTAMNAIIAFAETISNALGKIFGWQFQRTGSGVTDSLTDGLDGVGGAADDAAGSLGGATDKAKELKKELLGFDEITKLSDQTDSSGGGGSGGGSGGSGGGTGGAGAASGAGGEWTQVDTIWESYESEIDTLEQLGSHIRDSLMKAMDGIDWNSVYEKARGFGTGLATFLNGLFAPNKKGDTVLGSVGTTIAGSLNSALESLNSFGLEFNWENFGKSIADGISKFFETTNLNLAADTFNTYINGILDSMIAAIDGENVDWDEFGVKVGLALERIEWEKILTKIGTLIWEAIEAVISIHSNMFDAAPIETTILTAIMFLKFTGLKGFIGTAIWGKISSALTGNAATTVANRSAASLGNIILTAIKNKVNSSAFLLSIENAIAGALPSLGTGLNKLFQGAGGIGNPLGALSHEGIRASFVNTWKDFADYLSGEEVTSYTVERWKKNTQKKLDNTDLKANTEVELKTKAKDVLKKIGLKYKNLFVGLGAKIITDAPVVQDMADRLIEGFTLGVDAEIGTSAPVLQYDLMSKFNGLTIGVDAEANVKDIKDMLGDQRDIFMRAVFNSSKDGLQETEKTIDTTAKYTDIINKLSGSEKTIDTTAKYTDSKDGLSNSEKTISGIAATVTKLYKATGLQLVLEAVVNFISNGLKLLFKEDGGLFKNGHWSPIEQFAGGGLPNMGELFVARESGPELVGRMGGGTAVMNNNQIVASVSAGVYQAVAAAMSQFSGRSVSEVHVHLEGDAEGVFRLVKQENDRIVIATGEPALLT